MDNERPLPHLTDREVEGILTGRTAAERPDVAALVAVVDTLRLTGTGDAPRADAALAAVFADGLPENHPPAPPWALPPDPDVPARPANWRTGWKAIRVLAGVSAALGTVAGKLVLAGAIAAASIGAAQAAGVIDVPGLPGRAHMVDTVDVQRTPTPEPSGAGDSTPAGGRAVDGGRDRAGAGTTDDAGAQDTRANRAQRNGVEGATVSDHATSGAPQNDGAAFGQSVADDATAGTPTDQGTGDGNVPPGQAKKNDVPPGQAKKNDVPPGQAKKNDVPPGQAKKQVDGDED